MNIGIKKNQIVVIINTALVVVITTFIFHYTQSYYKSFTRGERYFNWGWYLKALPYLELAYKDRPESFDAGRYLVWTYDRLGRKSEAAKILESLSETYPKDFEARRSLADIYYGLSNYIEAEKQYRHALSIKSDLVAQRKLAEVLTWQKKYGRAVTILEQLHNTNPQNGEITELLADVYSWNEKYDKAIELYNELLSSKDADKNIILKLADALRYTNRNEEAVELYNRYIQETE